MTWRWAWALVVLAGCPMKPNGDDGCAASTASKLSLPRTSPSDQPQGVITGVSATDLWIAVITTGGGKGLSMHHYDGQRFTEVVVFRPEPATFPPIVTVSAAG